MSDHLSSLTEPRPTMPTSFDPDSDTILSPPSSASSSPFSPSPPMSPPSYQEDEKEDDEPSSEKFSLLELKLRLKEIKADMIYYNQAIAKDSKMTEATKRHYIVVGKLKGCDSVPKPKLPARSTVFDFELERVWNGTDTATEYYAGLEDLYDCRLQELKRMEDTVVELEKEVEELESLIWKIEGEELAILTSLTSRAAKRIRLLF